jgi:transketolase
MNLEKLRAVAYRMRRDIVRMVTAAKSGHPAGSLSVADLMAALYFGQLADRPVMNFSRAPLNLFDEKRDILLQSNGHEAPARYAALREIGAIAEAEMLTLRGLGSRIQGHPERLKLPAVEATSGPLGEGLSQGSGMALGLKMRGEPERKVFVLVGDGELDEGENWEAAMFAAKNRLNNLVAIVDFNDIQLSGDTRNIMPIEPLAGKFAAFGWRVLQVDGHDFAEILHAFETAIREKSRPTAIIAKTVAGRGIPSIEGDYHWHGKAPSAELAEKWLAELDENYAKGAK